MTRVTVYLNKSDKWANLAIGEPALFRGSELLEPPTTFLRQHYVRKTNRSSPNTWRAAAYALSGWLQFLEELEVECFDATTDELIHYREAFSSSISPFTGLAYKPSTIATRMIHIIAFYKFAGRAGWYEGDICDDGTDTVINRVALDADMLAHTRRSGSREHSAAGLIPQVRTGEGVRPFTVPEFREFAAKLGPLPRERRSPNEITRNALIAYIGALTGLRLSEINSLTVAQFAELDIEEMSALVEHPVEVIGKGRRKRTIAIPSWLVREVKEYIKTERAAAANVGRARGAVESPRLFVTGAHHRLAGRPISNRRIEQIIEKACVDSGVVKTVVRTNLDTQERVRQKVAKHCVHDLRHTYAVWTYWAEKRKGNPEPWKKIQAQLGHRSLTVTVNTYLRFVEIFGENHGVINTRDLIGG